jgi:hypothetical protein
VVPHLTCAASRIASFASARARRAYLLHLTSRQGLRLLTKIRGRAQTAAWGRQRVRSAHSG